MQEMVGGYKQIFRHYSEVVSTRSAVVHCLVVDATCIQLVYTGMYRVSV